MLIVIAILIGMASLVQAQGFQDPFKYPEQNYFDAGLGVTWLDGTPYTTFTLAPDISIGNFGVGIYFQLLFNNEDNWKVRTLEYEDGPEILRIFRYVRFGQKYDPYFFLVGTIERATLAHGFLMWNYNNASSYDKRRIGLIADMDFNKFGFETIWSSIGNNNLRGVNLYLRPLRFFNSNIPILDRFRIYGTYARDSKVKTGTAPDSTEAFTAYSVGADLQWLKMAYLHSTIYAEYGKFVDYGDGKSLGIDFVFPDFIGIFGLSARFEKRFIGDQFIPNVFGPLYELNRELGFFEVLENVEKTEGYFGELAGHVINRILLSGSFQKLNGIPNSGVLHLEASAPTLIPRIELRGYYDKSGIETFEDARTLDIRSVLTAEASYQLNPFLYFTAIYRWYWLEDPPGKFTPVERFEPRIPFRYSF
jgi:hypothetical protein